MPGETLEEELDRLRKEERNRLHADFARLSNSIDNLSIKVGQLAPQSELEKLETRVVTLENYKWLVFGGITAIAGLQGVQAFLMWLTKSPPAP